MNKILLLITLSTILLAACDLKKGGGKKSDGSQIKDEDSGGAIYDRWTSDNVTAALAVEEFNNAKTRLADRDVLDNYITALVSYSMDLFDPDIYKTLFKINDETISLRTGEKSWKKLEFDKLDRAYFLQVFEDNSIGTSDALAEISDDLSLNYLELAAFWGYYGSLTNWLNDLNDLGEDLDLYINSTNSVPLAFTKSKRVASVLINEFGAKLEAKVRDLKNVDKKPRTVLEHFELTTKPKEILDWLDGGT